MYFIQSIIIISVQYLQCTNFALAIIFCSKALKCFQRKRNFLLEYLYLRQHLVGEPVFVWCARIFFSSNFFKNAKLSTDKKKTDENFQFERICLFDFILLLIQIKLNCQSFFSLSFSSDIFFLTSGVFFSWFNITAMTTMPTQLSFRVMQFLSLYMCMFRVCSNQKQICIRWEICRRPRNENTVVHVHGTFTCSRYIRNQ